MTKTFSLNTYTFFPDIQNMISYGSSNYDYISLAFEVSFQDKDDNRPNKVNEQNVIVLAYLFVDHYVDENKKVTTSINFDYLSSEECGTSCRTFYENSKKKTTNIKGFKSFVLDGNNTAKMKRNEVLIETKGYPEINDILKQYMKECAHKLIDSVEQYLKKNHINYNQKDLNDFVSISKKEIKKAFSVQNVVKGIVINTDYNGDIEREIQEINNKLQADYLAEHLPTNTLPNKKIKI